MTLGEVTRRDDGRRDIRSHYEGRVTKMFYVYPAATISHVTAVAMVPSCAAIKGRTVRGPYLEYKERSKSFTKGGSSLRLQGSTMNEGEYKECSQSFTRAVHRYGCRGAP